MLYKPAFVFFFLSAQCAQGLSLNRIQPAGPSALQQSKKEPDISLGRANTWMHDLENALPRSKGTMHTQKHPTVKIDHLKNVGQPVQQIKEAKWMTSGSAKWSSFVAIFVIGTLIEMLALKTWNANMSMRSAFACIFLWVGISVAFCAFLNSEFGLDGVFIWADGYLLEVMLSFDNLFLFVLIMEAFQVCTVARNRILLLSVFYSMGVRLGMFFSVAALRSVAPVLTPILGIFIGYCGYKIIMLDDDDDEDVTQNSMVVFLSKHIPVTTEMDEHASCFIDGKATPSFFAVLSLIFFDTVFAADSVTAKSAVITSIFMNFTSSAFAMITLRAAYFVLDNLVSMFNNLKYGVGGILFMIAFMAVFPDLLPISNLQYMAIVLGSLVASVVYSVVVDKFQTSREEDQSGKGAASNGAQRAPILRF